MQLDLESKLILKAISNSNGIEMGKLDSTPNRKKTERFRCKSKNRSQTLTLGKEKGAAGLTWVTPPPPPPVEVGRKCTRGVGLTGA